jgi:hypothetical protein
MVPTSLLWSATAELAELLPWTSRALAMRQVRKLRSRLGPRVTEGLAGLLQERTSSRRQLGKLRRRTPRDFQN